MRAAARHVVTYSRNGLGPDRDQAILVAFASGHSEKTLFQVDGLQGQSAELTHPQPAAVKQFEECPVRAAPPPPPPPPNPLWGSPHRRRKEAVDFVERKCSRKQSPLLWRIDQFRKIAWTNPLTHQKLTESAQGA